MTCLIKNLLQLTLLALLVSGCSNAPSQKNSTGFSLPNGLYGHAVVNNSDKIFVLAGSQKGGLSRDIHIINPQTKKVTTLENKLLPRRYHSAVWDGKNSIYILGGVTIWDRYSKLQPLIEVYDIPSKQVKIIGEMPVPRRFGSAVYFDGKIIVCGGSIFPRIPGEKLIPTNTVAIFDIALKQWKKAASLPFAEDTRTVIIKNHIYAIGGYNNTSSSDHFSQYDISNDQWTSLAAIPQNISAHSAVAVNDKIYTFGDYRDLKASYVYDLSTRKWKQSSFKLNASRHNAATELNNVIYVIGGTTSPSGPFLDSIQQFSLLK
ncbi:hypothetical protein L0668_05970 [Paraglaciecola aquimarina]|uniref:Galactose oxidase n=1 Tax=Paraglaciecola algarum TaxID=3050085 RepID=A0ABS9D3Z1_9ALTE|nr:kelch repeat-containing protein [Paraglaciecola sp. G1-23]MCF2947645.1 hypothetical protein [Paraglaciecola sp. G1-23]